MITKDQIISKYGKPNERGLGYLTTINIPYPMRLAWDKDVIVNRISCHKLIAENLTNVFYELLKTYGLDTIKDLGIDIYGGCFNFRKMRGGNSWSTHSWGIAIDLDPDNNRLEQKADTARFARPEYKTLINTFYKHGFENLGVERNYDWMHFQIRE